MSRLLLLSLLAAVGASVPSGNSSQSSTEAPRNSTATPGGHSFGSFLGTELPVLQRAFYVLSGVCLLGVVYCTVRSIRLRKPERKKYGLLANYDENMEMGSVDSDEDTVFESKMLRR